MKGNKNNNINLQQDNDKPMSQRPSLQFSMQYKPPTKFTTLSESMAKAMINKLISKAITAHHTSLIEERLPKYCFKSFQKELNTLLSLHLIPYDKDESNDMPSISCNQSSISYKPSESIPKYEEHLSPFPVSFFNNYYDGENNWDEFSMPSSTALDRDTPGGIFFQQVDKPKTKKSKKGDDYDEINEEDKTVTETSKCYKDKSPNRRSPYRARHTNTINKSVKEEVIGEKKGKKNLPVAIPAYDIPKENKKIYEVINVDVLRQEKIQELKMNEKAREDMMRIEKEKQEILLERMKKQQELARKTITVDANGKIVEVKNIPVESLVGEFQTGISATNEGTIISNPLPLSTTSRNSDDNHNDKDKDLFSQRTNQLLSLGRKPHGIKQRLVIKALIPQLPAYKMIQPSAMEAKFMEQESKKTKFIPAGSCFDQIKLEVGVELTENTKYKSGGKDFHRKYMKYSTNAFKETNDAYNQNKAINHNTMPIIARNSRTGPELGVIREDNKKSNLTNSNSNKDIGSNEIKLMTNKSIKHAFDKLDLIYERDEESKGNISKEYMTSTQFFNQSASLKTMKTMKTANMTLFEQKKMDEMMRFNSTIMSDKNWGTSGEKSKQDSSYKRCPVKPQQKTIEQEIGMKMAQTKLPRARLFSYIKSPISDGNGDSHTNNKKMKRTSSTGFYKVAKSTNSNNKNTFSKTSSEKFLTVKSNI